MSGLALRRAVLGAVALAGWARAAAADAPPLTPDRRRALDTAIGYRNLGPLGLGYGMVYTVTPDGDRYRIEMPLGQSSDPGKSVKLVLRATPLADGRWALDSDPAAGSFSVTPPGGAVQAPERRALAYQHWSEHDVIDPSLAGGSTFDSTASGAAAASATRQATTELATGRFTAHEAWRPSPGGRVDATTSLTIDRLSVLTPKPYVAVTAQRTTIEARGSAVAPDRLEEFNRIWARMRQTPPKRATDKPGMAPPGAPPPLTPDERRLFHTAVERLRAAFDGVEAGIGMAGIDVDTQGLRERWDRIAVGAAVSERDGHVDARLRLTGTGLRLLANSLPTLPDLLPRHLALALHLVGAPAAEMFAVVSKAIDTDGLRPADLAAEFAAALASLPLTTGLEQMSFDVGPSTWTASGTLRSAGVANIAGAITVKATGFDALLRRLEAEPRYRQATVAMATMKGRGRRDGGSVTWDIVYAGGEARVNGTDVSRLLQR